MYIFYNLLFFFGLHPANLIGVTSVIRTTFQPAAMMALNA